MAVCVVALLGCGTTKWSDTGRTATEQLLISSAMDSVLDDFDFSPLSGRKVFIKDEGVASTDKGYLLSLLRQQLAANGVFIQEKKDDAEYILEVSTGAVGTNRYDLMYGVPETSVPAVLTLGTATSIPEIPFVKRTDQKAQIKLTMWAYHKETGAIIWQSGEKIETASIRNRWIFGAGPFTNSSFNEKTEVGGNAVDVPFDNIFGQRVAKNEKPSVKTEAVYRELDQDAIKRLEDIRKEGLALLEKPEKEAGVEKVAAKTEESAEKKTDDKKSDAEKKSGDSSADKSPSETPNKTETAPANASGTAQKKLASEPLEATEKTNVAAGETPPVPTSTSDTTNATVTIPSFSSSLSLDGTTLHLSDLSSSAAMASDSANTTGQAFGSSKTFAIPETPSSVSASSSSGFTSSTETRLNFDGMILSLGRTVVPR